MLRWRKAERQRLIEERLAIDTEERKAKSARIASRLDLAISKISGRTISGYWPFRGAGSRRRTIRPQPHDMPMDVIITDD